MMTKFEKRMREAVLDQASPDLVDVRPRGGLLRVTCVDLAFSCGTRVKPRPSGSDLAYEVTAPYIVGDYRLRWWLREREEPF